MKYSFVLMRIIAYIPEPGGSMTATPIAHCGCEADEHGVETLIPSGLILNFDACVTAFERENKTPVCVQMCFDYDYAQNSSTLKPFIDCSCD